MLYINNIWYGRIMHNAFLTTICADKSNNRTDKLSNFELCHSKGKAKNLSTSSRVIIIGASSFLGFSVASYLHNYKLIVTEDIINLPISDSMAWNRWKNLTDSKLSPKYFDFSNLENVRTLLKDHNPSMIVFIPSPIFDGRQHKDLPLSRDLLQLSTILKNFVNLLDILHSEFSRTRIILFTLARLDVHSIQKAWLKTFELSLSSYQSLYNLNAAIIAVDGVYGVWQGTESQYSPSMLSSCYHVDDVLMTLHYIAKETKTCIEYHSDKCDIPPENNELMTRGKLSSTLQWAASFSLLKTLNRKVIMTTYFINVLDPQHPNYFHTDSFYLLTPLFRGAMKLGINLIIFHNGLSELFQKSVINYYSHVQFVNSKVHGRTPNDIRFYFYYDYLLAHPEIQSVMLTDMRDVEILNNPFNVMEAIGDNLYIGLDYPFFVDASGNGWTHGVISSCFGKAEAISTAARLHPFVNAGVIGGKRHLILGVLHRITSYLDTTKSWQNCNMGAVTLVIHRYFIDRLYGGYPIQSGFKMEMPGPQGVAVKHKTKLSWN